MEYRKFKNHYLIRIDRGEEVLEKLNEFIKKEGILTASIEAIGACDEFTVGLYSVDEKKYYSTEYKGEYEIVSFLGNITTNNNAPYIHIHIGCAGRDNIVRGGHLNRCHISGTFEAKVTLIDGEVSRQKDSASGLNVFKF